MEKLACVIGVIGITLVGCSRSVKTDSKVFDSAPAEAKTEWQAVNAALKTNGYAAAVANLNSLQLRENLNAQQKDTVSKTLTEVMDTVFEKAGAGDPAAAAALKEIRGATAR